LRFGQRVGERRPQSRSGPRACHVSLTQGSRLYCGMSSRAETAGPLRIRLAQSRACLELVEGGPTPSDTGPAPGSFLEKTPPSRSFKTRNAGVLRLRGVTRKRVTRCAQDDNHERGGREAVTDPMRRAGLPCFRDSGMAALQGHVIPSGGGWFACESAGAVEGPLFS
jgi:hypothetical protein